MAEQHGTLNGVGGMSTTHMVHIWHIYGTHMVHMVHIRYTYDTHMVHICYTVGDQRDYIRVEDNKLASLQATLV